jgi:tetratricopeptide (TPR) repeat protein
VPVLELIGLIIASWISLAAPAESAAPEADLTEARRLFDEGLARYEAADYEGAIEVFTLALGEVRGQGVNDFAVRGLLLFNIGRAHMRAHEIDHDVEHLRQAQTIFERFVEDAESHPGEIDEADISEAREQLAELERMLATAEQSEPEPKPNPNRDDKPTGDPKQLRARGIGLTAAGAALLGGGVGMLAWGAGFGPSAEAKVAELDGLGLPPDSPAFADGDQFIAEERRKGAAWMAAGGVTAALGVAGVAIGIQQLVKAKRVSNTPSVSTAASFSRDGVWFAITGRF